MWHRIANGGAGRAAIKRVGAAALSTAMCVCEATDLTGAERTWPSGLLLAPSIDARSRAE